MPKFPCPLCGDLVAPVSIDIAYNVTDDPSLPISQRSATGYCNQCKRQVTFVAENPLRPVQPVGLENNL